LKTAHGGLDKKIVVKSFIGPNKKLENFYVDVDRDSVQIFPLTPKNKVYLVQQFRPGLERVELELPGGGVDKNENIHHAAARETAEEVGLNSNKIIHLASVPYSPYTTGIKHCFIALDCIEEFNLDLDENEFLQVVVKELDEVVELASQGKIRGIDTIFMGLQHLKKNNLL
jgi:8-oxo-dGTP pyrophosphatase MutT (NUDIX family)